MPTEYECHKCKDQRVVVVMTDTAEEMPIGDARMYVRIGDQMAVREHYMRQCTCVERKRVERLFKSSHISEEFRKVGFKGFTVEGRPTCVKQARDTALDYYTKFDEIRHSDANSIMLNGTPGSGKTHLLMAVSNGLIRQGISVHYFPWAEGFNELRNNLDELQQRIEIMTSVDVLFVDDLYKGRRAPTDFMLEQLVAIVYKRYLEHKPMLVSTEKTMENMLEIDEGVARRILERSVGHRVMMLMTDDEKKQGMELNYSLTR